MSAYNRSSLEKKGLLDIIRDGLLLLKNNYLKIVLPLFIFSMIPIVLNVIFTTGLEAITISMEPQVNAVFDKIMASEDFSDITGSDFSVLIQYFLISQLTLIIEYLLLCSFEMFGISLVAYHLYKKFTGQKADLTEDIKKSLNYKLILVVLILGPLMSLGLFIFIGGFIVFGLFIYLIFTYNMPEYGGSEFIKKSWKIGSFFKKVIILLIPLFVIHFFLDMVFESFIDLIWNVDYETYSTWITTGNYGMLILNEAVSGIARALLFTPLLVCLLTSLFAEDLKEYRVKAETAQFHMGDKEIRKAESFKVEEGMFCPFCGAKISGEQNYCPECGESLEFLT